MDLWLLLCKQQLHNLIPCSIASKLIDRFIGLQYMVWCVSYSRLETVD